MLGLLVWIVSIALLSPWQLLSEEAQQRKQEDLLTSEEEEEEEEGGLHPSAAPRCSCGLHHWSRSREHLEAD